ncbi:hypothetical protein BDN67DRAFT_61863 [Paxillus ammoniavirescens]|nr:hypothetical protein BDN67DRAFT_61863 [Paxillus ammoniavirescens]
MERSTAGMCVMRRMTGSVTTLSAGLQLNCVGTRNHWHQGTQEYPGVLATTNELTPSQSTSMVETSQRMSKYIHLISSDLGIMVLSTVRAIRQFHQASYRISPIQNAPTLIRLESGREQAIGKYTHCNEQRRCPGPGSLLWRLPLSEVVAARNIIYRPRNTYIRHLTQVTQHHLVYTYRGLGRPRARLSTCSVLS